MAPPFSWLLLATLACSSTLLIIRCIAASENDRQAYIVYMGDLPEGGAISLSSFHTSMLQEVMGNGRASKYLLRSYKRSFNGFVAKLTKDEMKRLSGMKGVVSVFLNEKLQLHTTRSWDFLGFPLKAKRNTKESDIIVGMLDSGVWPESASFSDEGFGPPPSKWKGICQQPAVPPPIKLEGTPQKSANFTCNNKIIGARYYHSDGPIALDEYYSPRDAQGHGTHTASTVAGGVVAGASFLGIASGTARGGVPSARIAVYKICWIGDGCNGADILAAFDDAIADGVDIISLSVGASFAKDYFEDPIAIGAFHSMKNGILTSNSAGNDGPGLASVANFSPWSLSVAASTIDRKFLTKSVLGDNRVYQDSMSLNGFEMKDTVPIIHGADAPNRTSLFTPSESRLCVDNSLDASLVTGKVVFCEQLGSGQAPLIAGAAGAIFPRDDDGIAFPFPVLTSLVNTTSFSKIQQYINSTRKPTAKMGRTVTLKDESAPIVASFSSRGPNPITSDILSPDIAAPGFDILAAWGEGISLTATTEDKRVAKFNIVSGTSMACPHASGVAAYVKSFHPTWSPAAIKSALLTTATPMNVKTNTDLEFAYGAGHLNPIKAVNPGLVYDAGATDYIKFLCGEGYSAKNLQLISGDNSSCTKATNGTVWDLNYPSFTLSTKDGKTVTRTFDRIVTNVGSAVSTYKVKVTTSPGLTVKVEPSVLTFKSIGQKHSFTVIATAKIGNESMLSGSLVWDDGDFQVRSSIVAYSPL